MYIQNKKQNKNLGFSLIEFMTVVTIFGIISSISVFSYNDYQDNIERTNISQDIALTIRQAQLYGISASNKDIGSSTFDAADFVNEISDIANDSSIRGISIKMNGEIVLFEDNDQTRLFSESGSDRVIDRRTINSSKNSFVNFVKFSQGDPNPTELTSSNSRVDITFKRPYPDAHITTNGGDVASKIYLVIAANDTSTPNRYIEITAGGNINVGTNYGG